MIGIGCSADNPIFTNSDYKIDQLAPVEVIFGVKIVLNVIRIVVITNGVFPDKLLRTNLFFWIDIKVNIS